MISSNNAGGYIPISYLIPQRFKSVILLILVSATAFSPTLSAQNKPALTSDQYDRWESLGQPVISPLGNWIAVVVTRNDEETELRVIPVESTEETLVIQYGEAPIFSSDEQWIAWFVGSGPDAEEDTTRTAELMNLSSGERIELGEVEKLEFGPESSAIAVLGVAAKNPENDEEEPGSDLRILQLPDNQTTTFGSVSDFVWHETIPLLAMTLATKDNQGNGLQVYSANSGSVQGLHSSSSNYLPPVWRGDAADILVLRSLAPADEEGKSYELMAWRDLEGTSSALVLNPENSGIGDGLVVSPVDVAWSPDGDRISFGLKTEEVENNESEEVSEESESEESDSVSNEDEAEVATVQIWHSRDAISIPEQISRATDAESGSYLAVWNIDFDQVIQVGTDSFERTGITEDWRYGIEKQNSPYPWENMFGRSFHDVWVVDLDNGERRKALEKVRYSWESAGGQYLLWYDGESYKAQDVTSGMVTDLTSNFTAVFANTEWDTPVDDFVPPWGVGGWLESDEAVLLYDQFNVWRVELDGSGCTLLTQSAAGDVVHRLLNLDPDELAFDVDELLFSTRDEWTEERGFARWNRNDGYERLISSNHFFSQVAKADSADALVYVRESKTDSPDVFVSGTEFGNPRDVLESNLFMEEYAWPTTELIGYTNAEGKRLQGTLIYPVNFDPDRKYPMIVYAYEILTPQTHRWVNPSERNYYNQISWAHEGYFVLLPDIVFRGRDPGVSTAETMDAAISTVEAKGLINRDQVGFVGHSWGGYHAAYLGARTNLFAATVAGAPLTDFVSFMGQFHWNSGNPESSHWETGQARMAVPYWEDKGAHERNSPLHGVQDMMTPILMAHGDSDGVVEYFQSTVFYNFARRAGKEMVLLTYEGENHGFNQKANQIDYHYRILEWFDHYLRGAEPQAWITDGVLWKDHEDEKKRIVGKE